MKTWIWRGILVTVVVFLGFAVYQLMALIPGLLLGNVQRASNQALDLEINLVDSLEGMVSPQIRFQIFKVSDASVFDDPQQFPLRLDLCLYAGIDGSKPVSVQCWERMFMEPRQLEPVLFFESSFFVPVQGRAFSFQARGTIQKEDLQLWNGVSPSRILSWQPEARVRLLDGKYLLPGESIGPESAVTMVSRVPEVFFSLDGVSVSPSLVVSPEPVEVFLPAEKGSVSLFQWIYPVPSEGTSASSQLCLQVEDALPQCYLLNDQPVVLMTSTCGNGVVEHGEECDDGNQENSDACTSQCVVNLFRPSMIHYPLTKLTVQWVENNQYLLFASVDPNSGLSSPPLDPHDLSIRLITDQGEDMLSGDEQRINGFPFLQAFLSSGQTAQVEFIYRRGDHEETFHVSSVDTNPPQPVVTNVKSSAAEVFEGKVSHDPLGFLNVKWLGSERSLIDHEAQEVVDMVGDRFLQTRVIVQSTFDEPVKIFAQLVDESVSFSHTLSPHSTEEIPIQIPDFSYGHHRFLISSLFPDGQRSADIVFPFRYRSSSLIEEVSLEWWQVGAIGILILLGLAFLVFRIGRWKMQNEKFKM